MKGRLLRKVPQPSNSHGESQDRRNPSTSRVYSPEAGLAVLVLLAVTLPLCAQSNLDASPIPECFTVTAFPVLPECPTSADSASFPLVVGSELPSVAIQPGLQEETRTLADDPIQKKNDKLSANLSDPNRSIYYRNKLEFGLDLGWLPINIPFVFDFLLGDGYNETGLNYTLVPVIASLRWHLGDLKGPIILRGNWDLTFSLSATAIPRGPETHYFSYIMGIRRNFVPRRWRVAPYLDGRLGLGDINAKGPLGVRFAQGQNFTFTLNLGSGLRYNLNSHYAVSAGLHYMHISNLYLSQPKFLNYGINVWGPMIGIDIRLPPLRKH